MAVMTNHPALVENESPFDEEPLSQRFMDWTRAELVWYAGSFTVHLLALSLLLLLGPIVGHDRMGDAPDFASQPPPAAKEPNRFKPYQLDKLFNAPPAPLIVDPTAHPPGQITQPEDKAADLATKDRDGKPDERMGAIGGDSSALAFGHIPNLTGTGPHVTSPVCGLDTRHGNGGLGNDFLGRGNHHGLGNGGGTAITEYAVNAALFWLANHQLSDGSWSLQNYTQRCIDKSCTGIGTVSADSGATALGLLPFLAAGLTHKMKGPYREHILRGVEWLLRHQQPDGNLAQGAQQMMYSHGLATIALSEAYGLTGDKQVGMAAQRAVDFILAAQNADDGGWRYNPREPGDTSVFGWELMALKSAHMAGLSVGGSAFAKTRKWLDAVAQRDGSEYSYQPGGGASPTMTSVGLLCRQYLGAKRDSPMLSGGATYLLNHLPDEGFKNIYYWYYATQVMHNMNGHDWDIWNRKMRNLLVRTQVRGDVCAYGSWDPANDAWGRSGGRVMQTSLSTLTLEIYYRYLPLFKADGGDADDRGADPGDLHVLDESSPAGDASRGHARKPGDRKPDARMPPKKSR